MALHSMKKDLREIRDRLRGIIRKYNDEEEGQKTFANTESLMNNSENSSESITAEKAGPKLSDAPLEGNSGSKYSSWKKYKFLPVILLFVLIVLVLLYFYVIKGSFREEDSSAVVNEPVVQEGIIEESKTVEEAVPESEYVVDNSLDIKAQRDNDAIRLSRLSDFSNTLIRYSMDTGVAFPVNENYVRLNEENSISAIMKKALLKYKKEDVSLIDPKDPDFYFAYRSLDGKTFEFTARMEIADDYTCEERDLKEKEICVYRFLMDESTISSVRNIIK